MMLDSHHIYKIIPNILTYGIFGQIKEVKKMKKKKQN